MNDQEASRRKTPGPGVAEQAVMPTFDIKAYIVWKDRATGVDVEPITLVAVPIQEHEDGVGFEQGPAFANSLDIMLRLKATMPFQVQTRELGVLVDHANRFNALRVAVVVEVDVQTLLPGTVIQTTSRMILGTLHPSEEQPQTTEQEPVLLQRFANSDEFYLCLHLEEKVSQPL